ncbi:hypothetical protein A3B45_01960 [Candidatus Daviesbacteria bacterium RIFCSPLOWO2_01_FULL_39_12]|uniref:Uncharacterized protein n=1 Tax=Candidatus Daviesbacteria bacterium RIFCSPLOWO2_01_FULL_39_12 TaxID=1797785 RepID=A0A1F5KM05_9BACT|nr:MAG: hypothetical protein A3D79_03175 [Candidatus Daviesbacteria bacterium RIFCSPHIGHO2_02_FULL_39_8]OGE41966.1 MAG: hypothetical protein A3B45_01960 [Candidatus Daviesbacteria bacterium RIFCSPLOWO2_01_FULL_39_12]
MERDYSQYSKEQLATRGRILNHKLESAWDVLDNIANRDFVEKRRGQKPNSNPNWLEEFNLKGLEGEAYFNKLSKDIIPVQLRLKRKSIPDFQTELNRVNQESYIRTSTEVLNLIIEDPGFTSEQAIAMLIGTSTPKPITPQKALEDLTRTVDLLSEREKLHKLDPLGLEVLGKVSLFGNFKQDLKDWFGLSKALEIRRTTVVSQEDLTALTNRIIGLVPEATVGSWFARGTLTSEQYRTQAINFAHFSLRVEEEGGPSFNPMEIVNTPDARKLEAAQESIRRTLSLMVTAHPQRQLGSLNKRWGNKLRELIDWLGGGGTRLVEDDPKNSKRPISEKVKRLVVEAIDNLPEVEQAMVLEISSLALLKDLGYIDLEECNENIFATYIRDVAFIPDSRIEERDDDFALLLDTAMRRSDAGTLDVEHLIDILCESSYRGRIIAKMMESAEFRGLEHLLAVFFVSHPATAPFAREIEGFVREDPYNSHGYNEIEEEDVLPPYRNSFISERRWKSRRP